MKHKTPALPASPTRDDDLTAQLADFEKLPTMSQWLDKLGTRKPVKFKIPPALVIRKMRDDR